MDEASNARRLNYSNWMDRMEEHRIKVKSVTTLLDGWSRVIRVAYTLLRLDGDVQDEDRDLLDRGDGVTVLLYNRSKQTVLLVRQPRIVATLRGSASSQTIEVCNGQVEEETPLECALREVYEETGHVLTTLEPIAQVFACPGASLEIVHLFVGEYDNTTQGGSGGGVIKEGEDIELLEVSSALALRWIDERIICDARSILALQWAGLHGYFRN
jgi:GDP-mannose pyrophosphatase NudK